MNLRDSLGKWLNVFDQKELSYVLNQLNILYRTKDISPAPENVFKAFQLCKYDDCKVVMLGLDPYPQKGVATGLLFGNEADRVNLSPSLQVVLDAALSEGEVCSPTLEEWSAQGVLLLNTALTIEVGKTGSHSLLWRPFMKKFIYEYSRSESGIIYVLFGRQAQSFKPYISRVNDIIECEHPAYFARTNQSLPSTLFKEINQNLVGRYGIPIKWGHSNDVYQQED